MEEEVQVRVQVEVEREEQGIGETHGKEQGEEQRERTNNTQAHDMDDYADECRTPTLEPCCVMCINECVFTA